MDQLHIPRDDKLSLPTRMRVLVGVIALLWGVIYAVYRLIQWMWH